MSADLRARVVFRALLAAEDSLVLLGESVGVLRSTDEVSGELVNTDAGDVRGVLMDTSMSVARNRESERTVDQSAGTAAVFPTSANGL